MRTNFVQLFVLKICTKIVLGLVDNFFKYKSNTGKNLYLNFCNMQVCDVI
jgi:hypothetical protein